jgi:acetoin utilization protein AcuB
MFVSMWMTKNPVSVEPTTSLTDLATLMARRQFRHVPVVAQGNDMAPKLVGMVTAADILHAFPPELNPFSATGPDMLATQTLKAHKMPVLASDLMTRNPVTIAPEAPIEEAARIMRDRKIGALPVARDGVLMGLITKSDIFRALVGIFESAKAGARITFDISQGEDVFPLVAEIAARRKMRVVTFVSMQKHERPMCVVEVSGSAVDKMLDDFWKSHHRVLSVIRLE